MPGQYIDIGFIYPCISKDSQKNEIDNLIRFLQKWDLSVTRLIASKDVDGEEYIELSSISPVDESCISDMLTDMYNGVLTIDISMDGKQIKSIIVVVYQGEGKIDGYYCISMSIPGDQIINGCDLMGPERYDEPVNSFINSVTNRLILFMTEFYKYSKYSYSFCDSEAMMECTPEELMKQQREVYSVAVVPVVNGNETTLRIYKSAWNIDGFSLRYETA